MLATLMSWMRNPSTGGCPVGLPPLFCGLPGFGGWKSTALSSVSFVPPMRSNALSVLVVGVSIPLPSRQGLLGDPSPSRATPRELTMRMPEEFDVRKSVKPVE
ncbi:MAG TPA: hypothetical protein VF056_09600 [Thermoleophilaceae bacterium]